jgi:hypothetical protein
MTTTKALVSRPVDGLVRRGRWRVDYPGRHGTNSRWFRTRKEAFADYWTHREAEIYDEGVHTPNNMLTVSGERQKGSTT